MRPQIDAHGQKTVAVPSSFISFSATLVTLADANTCFDAIFKSKLANLITLSRHSPSLTKLNVCLLGYLAIRLLRRTIETENEKRKFALSPKIHIKGNRSVLRRLDCDAMHFGRMVV